MHYGYSQFSASDCYSTIPPTMRLSLALEMATEISEYHERYYAAALALNDRLQLKNGKSASDPTALRLAQVLEELMQDKGQQHRLIDCLKSMQEGAA